MGLNLEDIVNKSMKMAEATQKARGIDNFGSIGFKYQQERAYNDAERNKRWGQIDEEQKRKDLLSNAEKEREKSFTLADMQNKREEGVNQRYFDVARIRRGDPLNPEGDFSGNAVPGVGGGGGSRTGSRGSGGKAEMSPAERKFDAFVKSNSNNGLTMDQINSAHDSAYATKPNAEGVKAFTGENSTAPEASRFPRYDGKPYTPISEPIAQGIGSTVAAQNIPQRSGLSASPSLSVQGSPQLSDVEERNRIRTERQARTGYVPTPNGPGYGYYKGEDLPPVGSYMNGRNGLTEVTPALQEQLRTGTAGTVSQGQYPGVKPGVTAQGVQNVAPTRSLPEQGQPSSSQGMQFNRLVPGMQGERVAEFIRPDGISFFTNNESMIQGATAPKNLSASEKQAVVDSEQMSRESNRKSTDVDKVKLAPLSEQDQKIKSDNVQNVQKDNGLLQRYTDAYNEFSNTPIGFGMGLQGINQFAQGAIGLNDKITQGVVQPAIDYLTTPMNRNQNSISDGISNIAKNVAPYLTDNSIKNGMSNIAKNVAPGIGLTDGLIKSQVPLSQQEERQAVLGDSERRVREERLKDRQNRRTVTSPSAIVYPTETSSPSAITVEPQRQPINLAQMGDSERRVREEQGKKRKKRRSPDNE